MRASLFGTLAGGGTPVPVVPSTNLYIDYNPVGQSYANNDPMDTFVDSVAARNGTATGTQRPVYKTNQINTSLPAVSFDGTNQYFNCVDLTALTAGTVHVVVKIATDPPALDAQSGLWGIGSDGTGSLFPYTDGNIYDAFGTTVRKTVGNPATSLAGWNIYSVWSATNDWNALLNGVSLFSTTTNTVGWLPAAFQIGAAANTSYKLQGSIARFLLYSAKQSAGDFADTITALQAIYAI